MGRPGEAGRPAEPGETHAPPSGIVAWPRAGANSARPMTSNTDLLAVAKRRLYPNYKPAPFVLVRGKGCELFDLDDERWLDLCAGVAVCSVGHAHPALSRVIAEQAATLMHTSNYFYNEPNIILAAELTGRIGDGTAPSSATRGSGGQRGPPQARAPSFPRNRADGEGAHHRVPQRVPRPHPRALCR